MPSSARVRSSAVIYSHSHSDHFGGVRGIVSEADVTAGKVAIIAPEHFMEETASENVMAGGAMGRRAQLSVRHGAAARAAGADGQRDRRGLVERAKLP